MVGLRPAKGPPPLNLSEGMLSSVEMLFEGGGGGSGDGGRAVSKVLQDLYSLSSGGVVSGDLLLFVVSDDAM